MLRPIDTCQNKVSADQYHVTISGAYQVHAGFRSDRGLVIIIAGLFGSRLTVTQD